MATKTITGKQLFQLAGNMSITRSFKGISVKLNLNLKIAPDSTLTGNSARINHKTLLVSTEIYEKLSDESSNLTDLINSLAIQLT